MSEDTLIPNRRISDAFRLRITELIKNAGLNNTTYAKLLHIDRDTITHAANYGIIPKVQILMRIADHHKITITYLLGDNDDEDNFHEASPRSTFHIRVKELCEEKKIVFSDIKYQVSFPYAYFYDWMREGTLPTLDKLDSIASYFGVSLDYLLGRSDDR